MLNAKIKNSLIFSIIFLALAMIPNVNAIWGITTADNFEDSSVNYSLWNLSKVGDATGGLPGLINESDGWLIIRDGYINSALGQSVLGGILNYSGNITIQGTHLNTRTDTQWIDANFCVFSDLKFNNSAFYGEGGNNLCAELNNGGGTAKIYIKKTVQGVVTSIDLGTVTAWSGSTFQNFTARFIDNGTGGYIVNLTAINSGNSKQGTIPFTPVANQMSIFSSGNGNKFFRFEYLNISSDYSATPPASTTNISLTFVNQIPADINVTNLFNLPLNITFNITGIGETINLTNTYLNFTTTNINNCVEFVNGSCFTSGYRTRPYTSNTSDFFNWIFGDNIVYPATYNINESIMESTLHNQYFLTQTSNYYSIGLHNVSKIDSYNQFEVMINSSGATGSLNIFYCNSSYAFSNSPSANSNCYNFYVLAPTGSYNHAHSIYSSHQVISLPINLTAGTIGSVGITPNSFFILNPVSNSNVWNLNYVPIISWNESFRYSVNNGNSWTTAGTTLTIDAHLHQYNGSETFTYQACSSGNETKPIKCSSFQTDVINLTLLPPTNPNVYAPNNVTIGFNQNLTINWTGSVSPTGVAINNYTIQLYDVNETFINNISIVNGNSRGVNYLLPTLTDGNYLIKVTAKDNNNLTSFGYGNFIFEYLYPRTTALINIFDELTFNSILENISVSLAGINLTSYLGTTKIGTITFVNVSTGYYTVQLTGSNYSMRNYFLTIPKTALVLNAYLLRNTSNVQATTFNIFSDSLNGINNADVILTKLINGSYLAIAQKNTGIGTSVFYDLNKFDYYRLMISASGYSIKTVDLQALDTEYTIYLSKNISKSYDSGYLDVSYLTLPSTSQLKAELNYFNFSITSPNGNLESFGVYYGTNKTNITGSASGGMAILPLDLSGITGRTTITVYYFFTVSNGNSLTIPRTYYINNFVSGNSTYVDFTTGLNVTGSSVYSTMDRLKGEIPEFYRFLIAFFTSIIAVFLMAEFTSPAGAGIIGLLIFAVFAFTQWINPLFLVILGLGIGGSWLMFGAGEA